MRGRTESEKKGRNSKLYKGRKIGKKDRKQRTNIERISKVLSKFTTSKTTKKSTGRNNRTRDKHKISKNHR